MDDIWLDIQGIIGDLIQLGDAGPVLKRGAVDTDAFEVFQSDGSTKGRITGGQVNGESFEIYDGSAETLTITYASGGTGYSVVMPDSQGAANSVLQNDGSGNLSWAQNNALNRIAITAYDLEYNSAATVNLLNYVDDAYIERIVTVVETTFDATGVGVEYGISGDTDRYVASNRIRLNRLRTFDRPVYKEEASAAQMIATFAAGSGGTQGSARIYVHAAVIV